MPESEMSKKITRVIKLADVLVQDIKKGTEKLCEAIKELKEEKKEEKKEDEEEKGE